MNVFMKDNFCTIYKLKLHQLQQVLARHGILSVDRLEDADAVISGVCAAFDADEARSVAIMKANATRSIPHYVIGCLVSVNPDRLISDYSYRTWEFSRLAQDLTGVESPDYDDAPLPSLFRSRQDYRIYDDKRRFVGVTTGCGFQCSYCPHLMGAGTVKSRPFEAVIRDVRQAIDEGATTIHLTGLDTASYGKEIGMHFGELLRAVLKSVGNEAVFHIAQFNPEGLGTGKTFETVLQACADTRVVDIQLPIQTSSERLLALMHRKYRMSTVRDFIQQLVSANPQAFLRTDIMIGFPTETFSDVAQTIAYVEQCFNEVAVYVYEKKAGTHIFAIAAQHEIPEPEKTRRYDYATEKIRSRGILVHSGGQKLSTLTEADHIKCLHSLST